MALASVPSDGSAEVADVVHGVADLDLERAFARHLERVAGLVAAGAGFAGEGDLAFAGQDFHDFRGAGAEQQLGRQDHADGLAAAVRHDDAVADALAGSYRGRIIRCRNTTIT